MRNQCNLFISGDLGLLVIRLLIHSKIILSFISLIVSQVILGFWFSINIDLIAHKLIRLQNRLLNINI